MPEILEEELENYIFDNYNKIQIGFYDEKEEEPAYPFYGHKILRQFKLNGYGVIDLLLIRTSFVENGIWDINFNILELKKDNLKLEHFQQLCRYVCGMQSILNKKTELQKHQIFVQGSLIVKKQNKQLGDIVYLISKLAYDIDVYFYNLDLGKGIIFEEMDKEGWYSSGEKDIDIEKYIRKAQIISENHKRLNIKL